MTHFLQQDHTPIQQVIIPPPNNTTPYGPGIQTQESMGAIPIQTATLLFGCHEK